MFYQKFLRQNSPRRAAALRTGVFLLLLPGLLAGAGCGTQAQNSLKVQEDLDEALRHAQVDAADTKARQWTDRAIAVAPHDPDTYFGPATPSTNDLVPQYSIATVFQAVGDDPALADYMTQATQKFPTDDRGFSLLIDTLTRLGRTADRKAVALQEIALLSKQVQTPGAQNIPILTVSLARAYWAAGDSVNGTAQYKKVIAAYPSLSSYPSDLGPYNGLAYAEAEANTNLPEALGLAQKALAQAKQAGMADEGIAAIQDTLGWVQYHQGHYAEAEQNLLEAANTDPRQAEVRYHLGLVYAAEGNTDAARAELGHAVLLAQGYAAAQQALSTLPKSDTPKSSPPKTAAVP